MSDLGYKVILGQDTFKRIETYQAEIRAGVKSGNNLASHIVGERCYGERFGLDLT